MLKDWLRIVRLPLAPTAVADAVVCAMLALRAAGRGPDAVGLDAWLLLAATSLLVYAVGMAANDLADREVDRVRNPRRPLPAGALRPAAVAVAVLLLTGLALVLGGGPAGERLAVVAALALALLYDARLERGVTSGALAMGGVRFANASIGVWPLVLTGAVHWLLLAAPLCLGVYSAAVTVLSTTEEQESPARVWVTRALAAGAFAGAAAVAWVVGGLPTLGVIVAFGVASSTLFGRTPRPGPPKRQVLEMLLGLYWLEFVLGSGAHDGSWPVWGLVGVLGLTGAWCLAIGSQLLVRWLRPAPVR